MKKATSTQLPFTGARFKDCWSDWLSYRKEKKLKGYVPTGLKRTFSHLIKLSNNNEERAIELLEYAMLNGWQGIHEIPSKQKNVTLKERKDSFYRKLTDKRKVLNGTYPAKLYEEFFNYWTAKNEATENDAMRFEAITFFDFNERLKNFWDRVDNEKRSIMWKQQPSLVQLQFDNILKADLK